MGCTNSQVQFKSPNNIQISIKKVSVLFIGGGPGSQKGKICEYLRKDFKFKYLSVYDIVQEEQQRWGLDSQLINRLFREKKMITSDLIVRLLKKAMSYSGCRKFIIDGFPNSVEDILEFEKHINGKEIDFFGYIHIQISKQKMILSGEKEIQENKNGNINENVQQIVEHYLSQSLKIKKQFTKYGKYHEINGQEGAQASYQKAKLYLNSMGIEQPCPVKILFAHFDDSNLQPLHVYKLVNKYGFHYYSLNSLTSQLKLKQNGLPKIQHIQITPEIFFKLAKKKFEQHGYEGSFLFTGFPRTMDDLIQWSRSSGKEVQIIGLLNYCSRQKSKKFKQIETWFEQKGILHNINPTSSQNYNLQILNFLQSENIQPRVRTNFTKVVFISKLLNYDHKILLTAAARRAATVIDLEAIIKEKIEEKSLNSEMIKQTYLTGRPIPGQIAVRLILQNINQNLTQKLFVVKDFPQSPEQLQVWEQEVGEMFSLSLIFLDSLHPAEIKEYVDQKIKTKQITSNSQQVIKIIEKNSKQLEKKIKIQELPHYFVNKQQKNVQKISDLLRDFNFI